MSKKIKMIISLMFLTFLIFSVCSCGGGSGNNNTDEGPKNPEQEDPEIPDVDKDPIPDDIESDMKDIHYLRFVDNGVTILNMVVLPTDTYESLSPYFPTIQFDPEYPISYWEKIDNVYLEDQLIVIINAYHSK